MIDLLLTNANIIDVVSKQITTGDVSINKGLIINVGKPYNQNAKKVINLSGKYLAPGFIDFHLHIESSMLSPLEFSKEAVKHGSTTIFVDPHEIANVSGRNGIDLFLEQADLVPLDMFVGIPSCVPATQLESAGASITVEDIKALIPDRRIYGLAEMMNFPGIIHGFGDAREKVDLVYDAGKIVDGHCPGVIGPDLKTYISNGKLDNTVRIMSDHETTEVAEALEKSKMGMFVGLRFGSASRDLERILPRLLQSGDSLDRFLLCSDDLDPVELVEHGHVDRIIRRARDIIQENTTWSLEKATITAISLATLHPSKYAEKFLNFHNHPGIGEISPGKKANLVIFDSLQNIQIDKVIYNGNLTVNNGSYVGNHREYDYSKFLGQVNVGKEMTASDFNIPVSVDREKIKIKVIEIIPNSIVTNQILVSFPVQKGELTAHPEMDIAKIAVIERHHATGNRSLGFVKGLGIKKGAIASTVAHDSHNLIVAGMDDECMAKACNYLIEKGGGMVVVGKKIDHFPLPISGLMSTFPIKKVVDEYKNILKAVKKIGSPLDNPFITLSFLALPVIPKLKITDKGLVDVDQFQFVSLV